MNRGEFNQESQDLRLVEDGVVLNGADVGSIHLMLDQLARAERAEAPADLSERILERSRGGLGAPVVARIRPSVGTPASRGSRLLTPLRAAAAIAMAATVGVAILASGTSRPTVAGTARSSPPLEAYLDAWASNSRDLTGDLSARVSALDAEMAALRDDLVRSSAPYDPWSDEGAL